MGFCSIYIADPSNNLWVLGVDEVGNVTTTFTSITADPNFQAPVLQSATKYWQLTADAIGNIVSTAIAPYPFSSAGIRLSGTLNSEWLLVIDDTGDLATNFIAGATGDIPLPIDVAMSRWPNDIGITSTIAGNSPLVVFADMSIWSCLLGKFINEDTTNIIVVLDE